MNQKMSFQNLHVLSQKINDGIVKKRKMCYTKKGGEERVSLESGEYALSGKNAVSQRL